MHAYRIGRTCSISRMITTCPRLWVEASTTRTRLAVGPQYCMAYLYDDDEHGLEQQVDRVAVCDPKIYAQNGRDH